MTLIEAIEQIDAGDIYGQEIIFLIGMELIDESREKQGEATIKLLLNFVENYPKNVRKKQEGEVSYYPRRKPEHSQLDIHKTIAEQFNLFFCVCVLKKDTWLDLKYAEKSLQLKWEDMKNEQNDNHRRCYYKR